MANRDKNEVPIDVSWPVLFIAIGAGYLAASLTPGIQGPGWIAFGGVYLLVAIVNLIAMRARRR